MRGPAGDLARWLWAAVVMCLILRATAVYVPLLQRVLQIVSPAISEWGVIAGCSLLSLVVAELVERIDMRPRSSQ